MTTIAAFLSVLAVIVVVHEFGHYLAARACGVGVRTFSLGFGPKLLKVRVGGTDFCVSAIPLGGYVKLAGTNVLDAGEGAPRAPADFLAKRRRTRALVYAAGPAASVLLGVALHSLALWQGVPIAGQPESSRIALVRAGSRAAADGFLAGDVVDGAAGLCSDDWRTIRDSIERAGSPMDIEVRRGNRVVSVAAALPDSRDLVEYGLVMEPAWLVNRPLANGAGAGAVPAGAAASAVGALDDSVLIPLRVESEIDDRVAAAGGAGRVGRRGQPAPAHLLARAGLLHARRSGRRGGAGAPLPAVPAGVGRVAAQVDAGARRVRPAVEPGAERRRHGRRVAIGHRSTLALWP